MEKLTVERCREILGAKADGVTDAQLERLLAGMEELAGELFERVSFRAAVDRERVRIAAADVPGFPAQTEEEIRRETIEGMRWIAHAHENGSEPDDFVIERIEDGEGNE